MLPQQASADALSKRQPMPQQASAIPTAGEPLQKLLRQLLEHVLCHVVEVELVLPIPFLAGAAVVHEVGPRLGNRLLQRVNVIDHLEVGLVLLDGAVNHLGVEAHCRDVEAVAVHEARGVGLHQHLRGMQGVGHIHHVHVCAGLDGAGEALAADGVVVDIDGVVGGAAARRSDVGDDAREADAARIDTILVEVPVAEQLGRHLRDAVDGAGPLHGVLRRHVVRRLQAERADRAGRKDCALVLAGYLKDVPEAVDADAPGQAGLRLSHHGQEGCEVVDSVDIVLLHGIGDAFRLDDVGQGARTALQQFALRLGSGDVACHNVFVSVNASQVHGQLRTNLSC